MLNSCDFQGRFAADPELRTTQSGKTVASFRMAVDRDMVGQDGKRPTDWLTFTAWGKTAEFVSKYFRKGSAATVHARCQTRQYQDKNGNNRTAVEFVVDNIYFAGAKSDGQQQSGYVDDGGTNPPATYRSQQPQQMGFATQNQRQQWQGADDRPGNVQVEPSFSQGSADEFSVIDDADDLPF
nr:MAG TPA: Single strand binding protein [Caudoviricetes sp.]